MWIYYFFVAIYSCLTSQYFSHVEIGNLGNSEIYTRFIKEGKQCGLPPSAEPNIVWPY